MRETLPLIPITKAGKKCFPTKQEPLLRIISYRKNAIFTREKSLIYFTLDEQRLKRLKDVF